MRSLSTKPVMRLYLVENLTPRRFNDFYDRAIVAAANPKEAARIHPNGRDTWGMWTATTPATLAQAFPVICWGREGDRRVITVDADAQDTWAPPSDVTCSQVGYAMPKQKPGVICASFIAE